MFNNKSAGGRSQNVKQYSNLNPNNLYHFMVNKTIATQ